MLLRLLLPLVGLVLLLLQPVLLLLQLPESSGVGPTNRMIEVEVFIIYKCVVMHKNEKNLQNIHVLFISYFIDQIQMKLP